MSTATFAQIEGLRAERAALREEVGRLRDGQARMEAENRKLRRKLAGRATTSRAKTC